jgi:hypothetical protein
MSGRHFDTTDNVELRAKIDRARPVLPLPALMHRLGYAEKQIGKTALCPFHPDEHPSFSVFKGKDGFWHYKCFVCDSSGGDEIAFLVKHFNISRREAIWRYLDMAGFPARRPSKSREYPKCPRSPKSPESLSVLVSECPEYPVSPVSNGQRVAVHQLGAELQNELKALAARNACTGSTRPDERSWQLARDLKAVAKPIVRRLSVIELMLTFDEWHRLSNPFLDAEKTRDQYWMDFLAQLQKVRVPTGEGTINEALQYVSKLTEAELPVIPGYANGLQPRKIAALHRELARRSKKKDKGYFLSYRDAAKVCDGLSQQQAHKITFALATVGVIEIVNKGKAGLNSGEAAEFRYLLSNESVAEDDDEGLIL